MLQPGQIIRDRYQLTEMLGQNPSRQTWLAEDMYDCDAPVVIKLLVCGDQVQWNDLKLFEREAQTLQQLDHPQIPKYRDYFPIEEQLLWFGLVQEYIPGKSLKEMLTDGYVFTEAKIRWLAQEVLQVLSYLHELSPPLLHRDLKPSNLMYGNDGHIHLVDFGSVQDRAAKAGATFTVVGTYGYAPLEQFGGQSTAASDLYALGATMIHLLTGIAPVDLLQPDAHIQFAHLIDINPGLARWLEKMTAPNSSKRFQIARDAARSLVINEENSSKLVMPPPQTNRIVSRKSSSQLDLEIFLVNAKLLSTAKHKGEAAIKLAIFAGGLGMFTMMMIRSISNDIEFARPDRPWWQSSSLTTTFYLPISIGILGYCLLSKSLKTKITLNSQLMSIELWLFGVRLRQKQIRIADIEKVIFRERFDGTYLMNSLLVVAGMQEYAIDSSYIYSSFSRAECQWLELEIQSWLGLNLEEEQHGYNYDYAANQ
jgi:serine/threonine protein kinase